MKKMKKVMALLVSFVMVLAMSIATFATEPANTFTITAPKTSHQYEIYQIFTGDLSGNTLSNVKWGANGIGTTGSAVDDSVLTALANVNSKSETERLAVIEQYVVLSNPVATITNEGTYTAPAGYYLIKDKDGSVTGTDSYTLYIVKVVGNVTITPKSDVPSFDKKIKDTNDTTGVTSEWQDSADYDIGDDVPFKLEGTVASNYTNYKQYYFAFHDKQEPEVLAFNENSVEVYVDDSTEPINKAAYRLVTNTTDGCTFEVIFDDLMSSAKEFGFSVTNGTKIRVEYTAKLTDKANIGSKGNVNGGKLEFSNNPNEEQNGHDKPETGETPWDNVIVFTYKVVVNKVDSQGSALAGAAFELSKKDINGNWVSVGLVNATLNSETGKYELTNNTKTTFEWRGLDDGVYQLAEIITPAGYNTISPIEFTVTADHNITWDGADNTRNGVLTSLTGTAATGDITFTPNADKSELATNVVNNQGSELPSTGGMGTTIFYVIGSVLVLGAAVLLITKKRMSAR